MKTNLYIYISEREKNGQTPELARDDWLESLLAEDMNVTVVVNHLTPTVTMGHVSLKKREKKHSKHFYCYVLFLILLKPTMNIYKKKWTLILKSLRGH